MNNYRLEKQYKIETVGSVDFFKIISNTQFKITILKTIDLFKF